MSVLFFNKQSGDENKDISKGYTLEKCLEMTKGFKSSFPDFSVDTVDTRNGYAFVIDESKSCEVGYKARAGEFLIQNLVDEGVKEIVYVQPRQGFAGISLSYLCKKYGLDLTLIMPSSKEASPHQLLCIELGAKPLFLRVAAMPNANVMAKKYSEKTGAYYVPLGLYHPDVIACGVRQVHDFFEKTGFSHPKEMWSAISTGVLTRTLQIALPDTDFKAVAVARHIQQGELGKAEFYSYHKPFGAVSDRLPSEFESEPKYDSKAWHYCYDYAEEGAWFFNVAGKAPEPILEPSMVDSYRDWGDLRDFKNI